MLLSTTVFSWLQTEIIVSIYRQLVYRYTTLYAAREMQTATVIIIIIITIAITTKYLQCL